MEIEDEEEGKKTKKTGHGGAKNKKTVSGQT